MAEPRDRLSQLERERWLLSEQSVSERVRTEQRLSPAAREQLRREDEELRASLFARLPAREFVTRVHARAAQRMAGKRARASRPLTLAALTGVVAALALALLVRLPSEQATAPGERAKGLELDLRVYRKLEHGVERLSDGAKAASHDVLQLGYVRDRYGFGVLLSLDGRGAVTLHQPAQPSASSALSVEAGERLLPEAYELDDAPGFERFVFVVAEQPLSVELVLAAARRLAAEPARARRDPLLLPVRTAQRSLLLLKPEAR